MGLAQYVMAVLVVVFIFGSIGGFFFSYATNATLFEGCPQPVVLMATVGLPVVAIVAIIIRIMTKRHLLFYIRLFFAV